MENLPVQRLQRRELAGQSIIAVSAQAHQVKEPGRGQRRPGAQPEQPPGHQNTQNHAWKIPQVIEGPIQQELFDPLRWPIAAVVPVQRQIQQHRRPVEQTGLFQKDAGPAPLVLCQKIAADHQEKRHRHPGQHPGEPEVPQWGNRHQRGGVVRHHQHHRRQTEEIQRRAPASVCHTYTSQTVTTNPFRLSPETWQQPSGKRSSVSSPAQGM